MSKVNIEIIKVIIGDALRAVGPQLNDPDVDVMPHLLGAMLAVGIHVHNEGLKLLREEVLGMGGRARAMASEREMKGYADGCEEVVKEIDERKITIEPDSIAGRLLPRGS